ncbi:MAG: porin family protein [Hyphomicrobium sp.]|nr:porin family protein [Hyphomicrobium sp.]
MDKSRALRRLALWMAAAVALGFGAQQACADGRRPGEPGRWVPGTPMTDSQDVSDWSGVYVGGKLGGAWSDIGWNENFAEFTAPGGASFSPSSFAGGVIGGANLQMGNWIFGLEASFLGMGLNASSSPTPTDTFATKLDWLLFVEPRIGYSWDRTMVFVKGGWAGGDATLTATGPAAGGTATARVDDFVDGWTIGGGLEYAWHPSFIVGVEYQYVQLDLGTAASCDLCLIGIPIGDPAAISGNADISLVSLRASYLFKPED